MTEKLLDSASGLRLRFLTVIVAAALLVPASSAGAVVTIGQVGDSAANCTVQDFAQKSVASGTSYVVPLPGTITSWTMQPSAAPGQQFTMKIYRKIAEPETYQVVGHAGPQTLTPSGVGYTFPANIPVKPGDLLGFHNFTPDSDCAFSPSPDDRILLSATDLADGASGPFGADSGYRLNIQATLAPDNVFSLGGIQRNKKKGTATLTVNNLPNPGELTASGKGVNAAGAAVVSKAVTPGTASLLIKAKGKKKRKLNDTGKAKLNAAITFTPTGGDPRTQSLKVKLKKNL